MTKIKKAKKHLMMGTLGTVSVLSAVCLAPHTFADGVSSSSPAQTSVSTSETSQTQEKTVSSLGQASNQVVPAVSEGTTVSTEAPSSESSAPPAKAAGTSEATDPTKPTPPTESTKPTQPTAPSKPQSVGPKEPSPSVKPQVPLKPTPTKSKKDPQPKVSAPSAPSSHPSTAHVIPQPVKKVQDTSQPTPAEANSERPNGGDSTVPSVPPLSESGVPPKVRTLDVAPFKGAHSLEEVDDTTPEAFIKSLAPRVQELAKRNDLYASIILAQAILESGYGKSMMSQKYFNIFNLTGNFNQQSIALHTLEYDAQGQAYQTTNFFRVYPNDDEALKDYLRLMVEGTTWNPLLYSGSWKSQAPTYQAAAEALQGVYATDPNYAKLLIELIQEYHLDQYDQAGKAVPDSGPLIESMTPSDFPTYNGVEYPGSSSYAFGNCTQYVYNRIHQLGGQIGQYMGNGGEWGANAQAQGYVTTSTPTKGDAVSFPPGLAGSSPLYGHVAFVEKVYADHSILVSEMNVRGNNIVSERHITSDIAALATYIQPQ
jgi:mannosyl-glycoprotein endo-beta-N-acetylglucosaminidase